MKNKPKNKKDNVADIKSGPPVVQKQNNARAVEQAAVKDPESEKGNIAKVTIICCIVVAGLCLSLLFHYYQAHNGKDMYPYNTFLFNPGDRYNDYYNIYNASVDLNPFIYSVSVYFPFTYILMHFFNFFDAKNSLLIFSITFIAFLVAYLYNSMPSMQIAKKIIAAVVLSILSYPFLFIIDRGNLEVWIFMSIAMFLFFYNRGKDLVSVLFLAIAISLKLYPAILAILFIVDKKYKLVAYTAAASIVLTVLSAAALKGGLVDSIQGQLNCLAAFNKGYMSGSVGGLQHNTSMFVPLKLFYYNILATSGDFPANYEQTFNKYYFIFSLILFAGITFVIIRYKMVLWKKIALIVFTFILLPQISYDYKLINLFVPLALFISTGERSKSDYVYCALFGLLLIPKDYYIITQDLSIASIINPLLIISIITLIIIESVRKKETINLFSGGK